MLGLIELFVERAHIRPSLVEGSGQRIPLHLELRELLLQFLDGLLVRLLLPLNMVLNGFDLTEVCLQTVNRFVLLRERRPQRFKLLAVRGRFLDCAIGTDLSLLELCFEPFDFANTLLQ